MSSAVEAPVPSVHHRHPLLWLIVAVVAAFALAAGVLIVHDSGTDSALESHAASAGSAATAPATPAVCGSQYSPLLGAMATSMSPEAVNRITPVLSEETRARLLEATEVLAVTNSASPMPNPVMLASAIGRLTPSEGAAFVAELSPATRDAVANVALDVGLVTAACP